MNRGARSTPQDTLGSDWLTDTTKDGSFSLSAICHPQKPKKDTMLDDQPRAA